MNEQVNGPRNRPSMTRSETLIARVALAVGFTVLGACGSVAPAAKDAGATGGASSGGTGGGAQGGNSTGGAAGNSATGGGPGGGATGTGGSGAGGASSIGGQRAVRLQLQGMRTLVLPAGGSSGSVRLIHQAMSSGPARQCAGNVCLQGGLGR